MIMTDPQTPSGTRSRAEILSELIRRERQGLSAMPTRYAFRHWFASARRSRWCSRSPAAPKAASSIRPTFSTPTCSTARTKLKGQREPVFPNGVPGTTTGVPADLVKGYQPPPDQPTRTPMQQAAAARRAAAGKARAREPKPKPKPKPQVARPHRSRNSRRGPRHRRPSTPTRIEPAPVGRAAQQPAQIGLAGAAANRASRSQRAGAIAHWPAPPPPRRPASGAAAAIDLANSAGDRHVVAIRPRSIA